ncbi:hypothetical protein SynPROSU1_02080 [Synechococcus sp. PROS-U-1]|nr:hypothetical protein SynPROSU1_02080 [Synechococcus sp. PROS-U-1]
MRDMGEPVLTQFLLVLLSPFLTVDEQDRLLGWCLGAALKLFIALHLNPCDQHHRGL